MAILIDTNKTIHIRKGDTGQIIVTGIPTDKTYNVYLSIYNEDKGSIISEISTTSSSGTAIFLINETFSNTLLVGEWYYAIKICSGTGDTAMEDTVLPKMSVVNGVLVQDEMPMFIIYEKLVKGDNE